MPWLGNRNPRANSLDKLSIGGHSGLVLRAHQGLQCIKQMVTSPKPQQGCPNSRNMGSSPMLREVNTYGKSFREKSFTARPINAGGKVSNLSSIQEPGCNLRGSGEFLT